MYTCVPEGHHHQHSGNEVDRLCPDHLTADGAGPLPELLDAVVPVIPVSEGAGKVQVLHSMDNFVGCVRLFLKVGGQASFYYKYGHKLDS